jgi:ion channel-forming bestrophin family protein
LNDVLVNTERVCNTPLPIAYAIAIQQITWLYIIIMPFQLLDDLGWITIPATLAASAIILSILFIGREIENPFGNDVNDLPLDLFCAQIISDLEIISARPKPRRSDWIEHPDNKVLYLGSDSGYQIWNQRPRAAIERVLRKRPWNAFENEQQDPKSPNPKQTTSASTTAYEKGDNQV